MYLIVIILYISTCVCYATCTEINVVHEKSVFCFSKIHHSLWNSVFDSITNQYCSHLVLGSLSLDPDTFEITERHKVPVSTDTALELKKLKSGSNIKLLIRLFAKYCAGIDKIPSIEQENQWINFMKNNGVDGLYIYNNCNGYYNTQRLISLYDRLHNSELMLVTNIHHTTGHFYNNYQVKSDFYILHHDFLNIGCGDDKANQDKDDRIFNFLQRFSQRNIIAMLNLYAQNKKKTIYWRYDRMCQIVMSQQLNVSYMASCVRKTIGNNGNEFTFDDANTLMDKTSYLISHGFEGIAIENVEDDDVYGNCDLPTPFTTRTKRPMLRAVYEGILIATN